MPPRRSVRHKSQTSTAAATAQSSAPGRALEDTSTLPAFPLPAPSPSTSHSTARILRDVRSLKSALTRPHNNRKRFVASDHVVIPSRMDEDRWQSGQRVADAVRPMDVEGASQDTMASVPSTLASSVAPQTEGSHEDLGDTQDAILPSMITQPRILVPSSSSPPPMEEESGLHSAPEPPARKRRRRAYSIHDETTSGPSTSAASPSHGDDIALALQVEFDALQKGSASTNGPAIGEASSSRRRIPVASSSKPSTSRMEVNLVSSRTPSPSPSFPPPAASSRRRDTLGNCEGH